MSLKPIIKYYESGKDGDVVHCLQLNFSGISVSCINRENLDETIDRLPVNLLGSIGINRYILETADSKKNSCKLYQISETELEDGSYFRTISWIIPKNKFYFHDIIHDKIFKSEDLTCSEIFGRDEDKVIDLLTNSIYESRQGRWRFCGKMATGPTGPEGSPGKVGPIGPTGTIGSVGFPGLIGPPGDRGNQGETGLEGIPGLDSAQGPVGPKGLIGPVGPKGDTGIKGEPGEPGIDGDEIPNTLTFLQIGQTGMLVYFDEKRLGPNYINLCQVANLCLDNPDHGLRATDSSGLPIDNDFDSKVRPLSQNTIAGGSESTAVGAASIAMGYGTLTNLDNSSAFGAMTQNLKTNSFAIGVTGGIKQLHSHANAIHLHSPGDTDYSGFMNYIPMPTFYEADQNFLKPEEIGPGAVISVINSKAVLFENQSNNTPPDLTKLILPDASSLVGSVSSRWPVAKIGDTWEFQITNIGQDFYETNPGIINSTWTVSTAELVLGDGWIHDITDCYPQLWILPKTQSRWKVTVAELSPAPILLLNRIDKLTAPAIPESNTNNASVNDVDGLEVTVIKYPVGATPQVSSRGVTVNQIFIDSGSYHVPTVQGYIFITHAPGKNSNMIARTVLIEQTLSVIKLNAPLQTNEDVLSHYISNNSEFVIWEKRSTSNNGDQLYRTNVDESLIGQRIDAITSFGRNIQQYQISPNNLYVVYIANQDTSNTFEIYQVNLNNPGPGTSIKLNSILPDFQIVTGFDISPNSSFVIYLAGNNDNIFDLYYVPISRPGITTKLNTTDEGEVQQFRISANSQFVCYLEFDLFRVILTPSPNPPIQLNTTNPFDASVQYFEIAANNAFVVYSCNQDDPEITELYLVNLSIPESSIKLNQPLSLGQNVANGFKISPDSSYVVYSVQDNGTNASNLFLVQINSPGVAIQLNQPSDIQIIGFDIAPNSQYVVYLENETDIQIISQVILGSSPSNPSTPIILNSQFDDINTRGVQEFKISENSEFVIYRADGELPASSNYEVYQVNVDAPGLATKLSSNQNNEPGVVGCRIANNSGFVTYQADTDEASKFELYCTLTL